MAEKIAELGIERDPNIMYFIKQGDVWGVRRKKPGERVERPSLIARAGVEIDYARYVYYLDQDGDIVRKERIIGRALPRPKKKTKTKTRRRRRERKRAARLGDALRMGGEILSIVFLGIVHLWGLILLGAMAFFAWKRWGNREGK